MGLTRRAFIGSAVAMTSVPSFVVASNLHPSQPLFKQCPDEDFPADDAVDLPCDGDGGLCSSERLGRIVFRRTHRLLADLPLRVVGRPECREGDYWAGGQFTERIYAGLPVVSVGTAYDHTFIEHLSQAIAREVRKRELRWVGRMPMPKGLDGGVMSTRRFSMRAVWYYAVASDGLVGRFDILGAKA